MLLWWKESGNLETIRYYALKQLRIVECLLELNNSTERRKKCGEISSWIDNVKPGTVQIVNLEKLFLFKVNKNRLIITSYSVENY